MTSRSESRSADCLSCSEPMTAAPGWACKQPDAHCAEPLFTPAPEQIPGQLEAFNPDEKEVAPMIVDDVG